MSDNQTLNHYLGDRKLSDNECTILQGYSNKISTICKFDKQKLKSLLNKFSETFFQNEMSIDKNIITYNRINDRVNEYFNRQKNCKYDYRGIINIIKYQFIVVTKYTRLLGVLTKEDNQDISRTHVDVSSIYKTSKSKEYIKKISTEYINNVKIKGNTNGNVKNGNTDDEEFKSLESIIINIMRKSLYIHSYLICYGSYTNHIIHNVKYEDIDVYFPESFFYMILLMFAVKMITGYNLHILGYPFIKGHLSLFYNNRKLIDCIYLSNYTLEKIRTTDINGIKFIDPLFQLLNQIRMNNELFRCHKIYENSEKYESVLYSFLLYIKDKYKKFDLKKVKEYRNSIDLNNISYKLYGNNICMLNIDNFIDIEDINDRFDKLIVILSEPEVIIDELNSVNGVYSIKYNAFLNEIFFESRTEKGGKKSENIKKSKINRRNFGKYSFSNIIDNNKQYLIMSNLTNTFYIDIDKNKISIKNIQSMLATLALYSFLKDKNEYGWRIFNYLISLLKFKIEDNFSDYQELSRYRTDGNQKHIKLNIENNTFNDFTTDKNQITSNYLDKSVFIATYGNNGGF
ncbi:putative poly(A) polymerase catalytic subunit [Linepithema humile entomopoxvirus 1]|uniref:putative poly(A) polymerase catalytic subunit n=1 Tax=Linepithema humile entomopoxvirus 1 TaxID=2259792 RepID=UPI000DF08589|nr:putative poly(A) polymerase catalytic subunit [Linepithema humile entomopoxvirus 1]AXA52589.1 putative poly(A) polymerase catalytic subunit [Linepithema humile entomopoxvirus 1]